MKFLLSFARVKSVAWLLVLLCCTQNATLGYQRQKAARKTKPQTSADASFDPASSRSSP